MFRSMAVVVVAMSVLTGCGRGEIESAYNKRVRTLSSEVAALKDTLQATVAQLRQVESDLIKRSSELAAAKAGLGADLEVAVAGANDAMAKAEAAATSLSETEASLQAARSRSRMLEGLVGQAREAASAEKAQLVAALSESQSRASSVGKRLAAVQLIANEADGAEERAHAAFDSERDACLAAQASAQRESLDARGAMDSLRAELESERTRNGLLHDVIDESRRVAGAEADAINAELDTANMEVADLTLKMAKVRSESRSLNASLKALQERHEAVRTVRDRLRNRQDTLKGEQMRLRELHKNAQEATSADKSS